MDNRKLLFFVFVFIFSGCSQQVCYDYVRNEDGSFQLDSAGGKISHQYSCQKVDLDKFSDGLETARPYIESFVQGLIDGKSHVDSM